MALGRAAGLLHQHHTQEPGWLYVVRKDASTHTDTYAGTEAAQDVADEGRKLLARQEAVGMRLEAVVMMVSSELICRWFLSMVVLMARSLARAAPLPRRCLNPCQCPTSAITLPPLTFDCPVLRTSKAYARVPTLSSWRFGC